MGVSWFAQKWNGESTPGASYFEGNIRFETMGGSGYSTFKQTNTGEDCSLLDPVSSWQAVCLPKPDFVGHFLFAIRTGSDVGFSEDPPGFMPERAPKSHHIPWFTSYQPLALEYTDQHPSAKRWLSNWFTNGLTMRMAISHGIFLVTAVVVSFTRVWSRWSRGIFYVNHTPWHI